MAEVWTSSCCNPLELPNHSWTSKKNLRPVTKWMCEKATKILMETPIRKKKLHQAKYPEQKVEKITAAMKKVMLCDEQTVDQDGGEMIQQLKQKFLTTNSGVKSYKF